ncbi:hypothetical protein COV93_02980 [Candidatus Woesearchaeota archaeon CG11_big_fil_rev_8_21_14_0_20_43_8]|nr:MAG: hypothetical protein COV93_02980 [Candidatus Woesearchaeota archaeon CG11_big_fil_rev_8_21_14_0_20_43_8]
MEEDTKKTAKGSSWISMQPVLILIVIGVVVIALSAIEKISDPTGQAVNDQSAIEKIYDDIQKNAAPEPVEEKQEEPAPVIDEGPKYSSELGFYLDDVKYSTKKSGHMVVDSLKFTIVNDIAFKKEYDVLFYLYDDTDDSVIRLKPQITFHVGPLDPGEEIQIEQPVNVQVSNSDNEKTLKFRVKDELDVIMGDYVLRKNFTSEAVHVSEDFSEMLEIIPFDIGFEKDDSGRDFGTIKNMSVIFKNDMISPLDFTLYVYLFDEDDESLIRNQVRRKVTIAGLQPGVDHEEVFPVHISFNQLDKLKTIRFKAVSQSKVIIADVEYKKMFS